MLSVDSLFALKNRITISGTYANLHGAVRTDTSNYTDFPFDLSAAGGDAAMNLQIGLLAEGSDYAVHFWDQNGLINRDISIGYNLATNNERLADIGEETDSAYRSKLAGLGTLYDGLTNRSNIIDFDPLDTATGQNLTFLVSVDTTGFAQINANGFFSTSIGQIAKTGLSFAVFNNQPWLQVSANVLGGPNYNFIPPVTFLQKRHVVIYTLEWLNVGATVDLGLLSISTEGAFR